MSKEANQSDKWDYAVVQLQMKHPITGRLLPNEYGNFRTDTDECIGRTSDQYGLIQNKQLLEAAHIALEKKGLAGYTEKTLVTGNGRRFFTEFTFANKQLASAVGDVFGYKLTLKNSFDRSIRAAIALGFLRLTCLNGASTMEREFNVTRKHSANVTIDFLGDAIDKAIDGGAQALKVYDAMAKVELPDELGVNVLNQLVVADVLSGSLMEDIQTLWLNPRRPEDKARTLYSLYNAVTEHLTHKVEAERYEYAAKVNNSVLVRLVNAARHPDRLAKLILPVPTELVSVTVDGAPMANAVDANVIEAEVV